MTNATAVVTSTHAEGVRRQRLRSSRLGARQLRIARESHRFAKRRQA